ncbi:hypothetical protein CP532_2291 [Ophiocordyceps camponoti-leonardi (nom. inval.)]|nr:hypothetical protein CP532_2291 [Ophiocordyceps camponoti-leonardi (nom. inval.)]
MEDEGGRASAVVGEAEHPSVFRPASVTLPALAPPPPIDLLPFPTVSSSYTRPISPSPSPSLDHDQQKKTVVDYDYDVVDGHHPILHLRPSHSQWQDFPAILAYAKTLGAESDGCFKVSIPESLRDPLPEKAADRVPANAYKIRQIKKTTFWQVCTVPSDGEFGSDAVGPNSFDESVAQAVKNLKRLFRTNKDRQMRSVRYRVDVPAWTANQRRAAGVPERSPIHPLKGDGLDHTRAIIPGIHTPYVYESGPYFGATFQIHAEDFRLASLNHLYKGRKIWIVVPATAVDVAEAALGRDEACSQFMRHRAEFFFPDKLDKLGIPYRIVDQRPGETMVILPDAYHEGFSTGYTIAEARNYADCGWNTDSYQPCQESCRLATAIPAALMRPLADGEERLDLCAAYGDDGRLIAAPSPVVEHMPLPAAATAKPNLVPTTITTATMTTPITTTTISTTTTTTTPISTTTATAPISTTTATTTPNLTTTAATTTTTKRSFDESDALPADTVVMEPDVKRVKTLMGE